MIEIPGAPVSDREDEDQFHTITVDKLAAHHEVLLDNLQQIADGTLKRLIVIMPPGSAKSTYCSVVFPAWLMGVFAKTQVILACYGSDLARKQGRRARQLVKSKGYQALFPGVQLSSDSAAADEWAMTNGSEFMGGGLLSGLTGNRADVGICDDPIKGRAEAESETIRESTKDAIRDDFDSRVKPIPVNESEQRSPRGAKIYITTRWHQDDPVGAILPANWAGESGDIECRDGQVWRVLCIPAQADRADDPLGREIGEYLWKEWFPEAHWAPFKRNSRTWTSLYQGKPSPGDGNYFKKDWLRPVNKLPPRETLKIYGGSDYATTADGGDYTVHIIVGVDPLDRIYILDLWRAQTTSMVWVETFCDLVKKWKPIGWAEEAGQIKASVGPFLLEQMRKKQAYVAREQFPTRGDKGIRAQSIRGRMEMDGLYYQDGAEWFPEFESELVRFPAGVHDDQVDALGLVGQLLDRMEKGRPLTPNAPKPAQPRGTVLLPGAPVAPAGNKKSWG